MLARRFLSVAGVIVLTACGHHSDPEARRPTPSQPPGTDHSGAPPVPGSLDCSAHILAHGPSRSYHAVLGAVALQAWPDSGVLQASSDHTVGAPHLFAKTGLLVRAGVSSTITAQSSHRVVRIGWRNGAVSPTRRVEVPPCPRDGTSRWLAFPGGYWVDRPACVTVTVRARGQAESFRVAVGAPCS